MELRNFAHWIDLRWPKERDEKTLAISALGLCGEAGETAEHIKKYLRGSGPVDVEAFKLEMGDVLHYWCVLANYYGLTVESIIDANIEKLVMRDLAKGRGGAHVSV